MNILTEDVVRTNAGTTLNLCDTIDAKGGVGQITTFNQLGFAKVNGKAINDKPDGWFLPKNKTLPALILEAKASDKIFTKAMIDELHKNCTICLNEGYSNVFGILYNGEDILAYLNNIEIEVAPVLQDKEYYFAFLTQNKIDKQKIYTLTSKINNCLHFEFGIKNLYHRMIFTACALVAKRYGARLYSGMDYPTFHTAIHSTLAKSLIEDKKQNQKLDILLEVYSEIKMNSTENQKAIDSFIDWIGEISDSVNSDYWNGEDVMGIFFNEFNRYKKKSENGQIFTPDHITSLMYRLLEVHQNDVVLDAACGSGAFLVKSMCNMIKEAGGVNTQKAKDIKALQLYGIEFDREIYALACANMLIHKDGKTNLEQMDTRTDEACKWMKSKPITKVLMNPPFENKYGCLTIVKNVLDSMKIGTQCAFILPDKKLEKVPGTTKKILQNHSLRKIVKLPENLFDAGITTSIFIFEVGIPQNDKKIFACYIEDDGLETVKNQGRQDIKDRWRDIENYWVSVINERENDKTVQSLDPKKNLSYQMPEKPFEISEEDFVKTIMDYLMFEQGIDVKDFNEKLTQKVIYSGKVSSNSEKIIVELDKKGETDE